MTSNQEPERPKERVPFLERYAGRVAGSRRGSTTVTESTVLTEARETTDDQ